MDEFGEISLDKKGLTHLVWHEIHTVSAVPVASKLYKYDRVKQRIIDYQINKILADDIIMSIDSPFASPVVLCRENNGDSSDGPVTWRFSIIYRKLNANTQYPRFLIPVIDVILDNITRAKFMSSLDLISG